MNLSDFRKEYSDRGLHRIEMNENPIAQFEAWFQQSIDMQLHEPNAMSLATVDSNHQPLLRTVLLKSFDERGFVFFSNYESRKGSHIAKNSHVSLLFPWITLERQVIIQGVVEKISTEESLAYFTSRPRESQIGAWVSEQSSVIESGKFLINKLAEISAKFHNEEIPLPPFWGGYRVIPTTIEFWQGGPARLHDRFRYTKKDDQWSIDRLSP
jgi:pyridoxamine 5'-phosphate oxidase